MPDAIFANPRLAEVYDPLDPDRSDLDDYLDLTEELRARSVVDIGCGTGTFACLLAKQGMDVTGADPAAASLDVARRKPYADRVRWVHGDASSLQGLQVDLATMTANVAQVFVTDEEWARLSRPPTTPCARAGGWCSRPGTLRGGRGRVDPRAVARPPAPPTPVAGRTCGAGGRISRGAGMLDRWKIQLDRARRSATHYSRRGCGLGSGAPQMSR